MSFMPASLATDAPAAVALSYYQVRNWDAPTSHRNTRSPSLSTLTLHVYSDSSLHYESIPIT
ncbi:hypothetical protein BOTBODRAFT_179464 [Botryobasidium botryosum FD-172 SS1]|uniref:Uncharacterized protein n=1 Tax=Botryobasidium botryosum (strain FD-172 SS1) TaxID=930990 RepID=A0A067MAI4_BOTB1|nr:hypothetical protein BOTBODRAFT_179464 [Botryobasidium botryosum FD-172 SS1]